MQSTLSQLETRKWTDRRDSAQLLLLRSVLTKLFRSEEKKWLQYKNKTESPLAYQHATAAGLIQKGEVRLSGGESVRAAAMSSDCLVEHGRLTDEIHRYFGMLERNRVLLNMGAPRTFNNMRVVKGGNDVGDGSDTVTACDLSRAVVLCDEDLTLYRSCLMCAHFPALCTPELPSPSPCAMFNTNDGRHHSKEYLSQPDASKSSRLPYELSSPFDGLLQESPAGFRSSPKLARPSALEDDDLVTVDGLKLYVRNLFKQTEQQQFAHERNLREMNGRRNPSEILAKELVTQLSFLESNSHPYYQLQSFVNKNAYDQWAQWEKQKIRHLISLFWQYCYPRPVLKGRRPNYHSLYRKLLSKVASLQTKTAMGRHHIVLKDLPPSRPLSANATRLLREFGLRFGVGEMYRRLVYLDYLARHFENDIWYIQHTSAVLASVQDLLPTDSSKMVITKEELEMLTTSVVHLRREAEHSLTRLKRLFPQNDPPEGLASLIELLRTALCGYQYVDPAMACLSLDECLQRYIVDGFAKSYERHKTIAQAEMGVWSVVQPVTPELIGSILTFIQDEVASYKNYFHASFKEFFNVTKLAVTEFYRMLCDDVAIMCKKYVPVPDQLDLEMLSLAYKLTELDEMWSAIITPEMQVWRDQFVEKLADMWLDPVGNQLLDWVVKSVAHDEWEIVSFSLSTQLPLSSGRLKSCSPDVDVGSPKPTSVLQPSSRSAFTRVSRVKGEDSEVPCLVHRPSSYSSSSTSQRSGSTISMADSIRSRVSSVSIGRLSGPNDNELMASFEQASQTELPQSMFANSTGIDATQGHETDSSDGKPTKLLTFGSLALAQGDEMKQSPSFVRRTRSLAQREPIDQIELHHGDSKQRKTSRKQSQARGIPFDSNSLVESNSLENATPVAISVSRPCLLKLMSNFTADRGPSLVGVQLQPNATSASESTGALTSPLTVNANNSVEKKTECEHSVQPPCGSRSCSQMQTQLKCQPVTINRQQSPKIDVQPATFPSDNSCVSGSDRIHRLAETSLEMANSIVRSQSSLTDSLTGITEGTFCPIDNARPSKPPRLPISSSVFDIISGLIRMARFMGNLNCLLTPKPSSHNQNQSTSLADESPISYFERSYTSTKYEHSFLEHNYDIEDVLRDKLVELLNYVLIVYANNMLCTDLCMLTEQVARHLIGDEVLIKILDCKKEQLLWGCRHMVPIGQQPNDYDFVPDCLQYEKAGQRHTPNSAFEKVSVDMCIRINNVTALRAILPALHAHLMGIAKQSLFTPAESTASFDSGYHYGSPAHVANGSPCSPVKRNHVCREANASQQSMTSATSDTSCLHKMDERLARVEKAQIRLMCYRLNHFVKPSLMLLLSLTLPEKQYPLARRLDPILKYLSRHLHAAGNLLYPHTFTRLLHCLWDCIVSDFKEFADNLLKRHKSRNLALLYLRAIALLVEFFHAGGAGLDMDVLVTNAKYVFELLELHALSTQKLIVVYNQLSQQEESISLSDASGTPLLDDLRHSLHRLRKCFTGREFTDTVVALKTKIATSVNADDMMSSSSPLITTPPSRAVTGSENGYAVQLGQQLLDDEVIQRVAKLEDKSHLHEPTPLEGQHQFIDSTSHLYRFVTYQDKADLSHSSSFSSHGSHETTEKNLSETDSTTQSETHSSARVDSGCVRKIIVARSSYDKYAKQFV